MNKINKQYPMTDRLIVRRGYFSLSYMWGLPFYSHMENTLFDCIFSLRGEVWAKKKKLTPTPFIGVPVPNQESEMSYICVLGFWLCICFYSFWLDFGTVPPAVWYFLFSFNWWNLLDSFVLVGRVTTNKQPKIGGWSYVIKI